MICNRVLSYRGTITAPSWMNTNTSTSINKQLCVLYKLQTFVLSTNILFADLDETSR